MRTPFKPPIYSSGTTGACAPPNTNDGRTHRALSKLADEKLGQAFARRACASAPVAPTISNRNRLLKLLAHDEHVKERRLGTATSISGHHVGNRDFPFPWLPHQHDVCWKPRSIARRQCFRFYYFRRTTAFVGQILPCHRVLQAGLVTELPTTSSS